MKCGKFLPLLLLFFLSSLFFSHFCFSQEKENGPTSENETAYWKSRALKAEELLLRIRDGLTGLTPTLDNSNQLLNNSEETIKNSLKIIELSQQSLTDIKSGLLTISEPPEALPEPSRFGIGFAVGAGCTLVVGIGGLLLFAKLFPAR